MCGGGRRPRCADTHQENAPEPATSATDQPAQLLIHNVCNHSAQDGSHVAPQLVRDEVREKGRLRYTKSRSTKIFRLPRGQERRPRAARWRVLRCQPLIPDQRVTGNGPSRHRPDHRPVHLALAPPARERREPDRNASVITVMSRLTVLRAHALMLCGCRVCVMRGAKWLVRHKMVTPAWEERHACNFMTRRACQRTRN
jgi:hypothetical protein